MKNMNYRRSWLAISAMVLCLIVGTAVSQAQKTGGKPAGKATATTTAVAPVQVSNNLTAEKINAALDEAYTKFKDVTEGKNADYIKELARVDPEDFRHCPCNSRRTGLYEG